MPRSIRNAVVLLKLETTSGTDAGPSNTTDAVLFYATNMAAKITPLVAERDVNKGTFGAPDKLIYTRRGEISFSVDAAGSGTAGSAPAWGKALQACAFAETVTAGQRVEYTPASTSLKTATIWAYVDGALRKFVYCAGSVKLGFKVGAGPTLDFTFTGLVAADPSAASVPTPTLTAWQRPLAVGPLATSALKLGGTYSAGALSGGTDYNFSEFNLDVGNDVSPMTLAVQEVVSVDNRAAKCDFTGDISAANEVTLHGSMKAGTATSIGLLHGTTGGNKVLVFGSAGVITGIDDKPQGNKLLQQVSLDLPPTSGNDELRIVAL